MLSFLVALRFLRVMSIRVNGEVTPQETGLPAGLLDQLAASDYRGVLTLDVCTEHHFFPGQELVLGLMEGRA